MKIFERAQHSPQGQWDRVCSAREGETQEDSSFRTTKGIKKKKSFIFTEKRYKKDNVYTKVNEFRLHINWSELPA